MDDKQGIKQEVNTETGNASSGGNRCPNTEFERLLVLRAKRILPRIKRYAKTKKFKNEHSVGIAVEFPVLVSDCVIDSIVWNKYKDGYEFHTRINDVDMVFDL